jgi:hypothetical protein
MSGSTTELGIATAVDGDDNADYLTIGLKNGLQTLDALFNNQTGHNHSASHQGGPITTIPASAIPDGSITSAKIADGTITGLDFADGAVTTVKLGDGSVTNVKLAANAVTTDKIVDGTIQGADLAAGTITSDKIATFSSGPSTNDWFRVNNSGAGIINVGVNQGIAFDASGGYAYPSGDRLVTAAAAQTLTNKTLSAPAINNGTISSATINNGSLNSAAVNNPTLGGNVSGAPGWVQGQTFPSLAVAGNTSTSTLTASSYGVFGGGTQAASGGIRMAGDTQVTWRAAGIDYGIWYDSSGRLNFSQGAPGIANGASGGSVSPPTTVRGFLQVAIQGVGTCKIPIFNN